MSWIKVLPVVLLVILSGCGALNGGGGSSGTATDAPTPTQTPAEMSTPTPTESETSTDTPTDSPTPAPTDASTPTQSPSTSTPTPNTGLPPGVRNGKVTNASKISAAFFRQSTTGPVKVDMTFVNKTVDRTRVFEYTLVNDTSKQLYRINRSDREGSETYYITDGADAVRNTTSGEIRYARGENNNIEFSASFSRFFLFVPSSIISTLEWEVTGEETINGDTYYELTAQGINRTAVEQAEFNITGDFESASGTILVRSDGFIYNAEMTLEGTTARGDEAQIDISLIMREGSDIQVEQPPWFDESQVPEE